MISNIVIWLKSTNTAQFSGLDYSNPSKQTEYKRLIVQLRLFKKKM